MLIDYLYKYNYFFLNCLNYCLKKEAWAKKILAQYSSKVLYFSFYNINLYIQINENGYFNICSNKLLPDVTINISSSGSILKFFMDISRYMKNKKNPDKIVHISGDAFFAEDIVFVLMNLRLDTFEELSKFIGDIKTLILLKLLKIIRSNLHRIIYSFCSNIAEFLTEETNILISHQQMESLYSETVETRIQANVLNNNLQILDQRLNAIKLFQ